VDFGEKVLFSKNNLRKVFEKNDLARSGWPVRGGFVMLVLVLPPVSIIWGVSRDSGLWWWAGLRIARQMTAI
jgi:hypothetical protein